MSGIAGIIHFGGRPVARGRSGKLTSGMTSYGTDETAPEWPS